MICEFCGIREAEYKCEFCPTYVCADCGKETEGLCTQCKPQFIPIDKQRYK